MFSNKFNYKAYRYLKLSNLRQAPKPEDITAYLIHTDYSGSSSFACSDKDLIPIHIRVQLPLVVLIWVEDLGYARQ